MQTLDAGVLARAVARLAGAAQGSELERDVSETLVALALKLTGFDMGTVLTGGREQRPTLAANHGVDEGYARFLVEHYVRLPGMKALEAGQTLRVPDVHEDEAYALAREGMDRAGIRSLVVFPFRAADEELLGALTLYAGGPTDMSDEVVGVVEVLVAHTSLLMSNHRLLRPREYLLQQTLLEKSQEVVSALAAGIAHDFNNLLGGMLGMVTLAPSLERAELKRLCEQLEGQVDQAAQLTRNLLDLARTTQPEGEVEQTDLVTAVSDAVDMVTLTVQADTRFDIQPEYRRILARISPMAFSRVILNLLLNGMRALSWVGGGCITIRLRRDHRFCVIEVDDDGPGVPPDQEEEIFDAFVSLGRSGGSGVGLSAARGIVERAGGTLTLKHREGPGACFVVRIPAQTVDATTLQVPAVETDEDEPSIVRGINMLLAEDEPVQRRAFTEALEAVGYHVDEVADGAQAVQALDASEYDVLVLDHAMPEVTGASLLSALRTEGSQLPVVLVTGFGSDPQLNALAADPHTRIVSKPVRVHTLVHVIEELLLGQSEE